MNTTRGGLSSDAAAAGGLYFAAQTILNSHMLLSRREAIRRSFVTTAALSAGPLLFTDASGAESETSMPIRELYCPAHFGNSYEAMWPGEMKAYLAEQKWWGFNRYSDWITTTDVRNPYTSDAYWDLGREQLERKKKAFRAAQDLGFDLNLIITANHVYLDQLQPDIAAKKTDRIFGQLLCPSETAGRKTILENTERWFRDLAESGIHLSAFTAFAYDYGGCSCSKCDPWIVTFARLIREIHELALKHHPKIEPWFCSWWWQPQEHVLFNEWAKKEAPGWVKGMTLHIEYEQTRFKDVAVPDGCRKVAFLHNSYADTKKHNDIYAKWGPTIAPRRIPQTLADIRAQGADGFQAYTEGVFDDCNKAILGGLSSGKFSDSSSVLRAYAMRYFELEESSAERWAQWLAQWGNRREVKLPAAAEQFEILARNVKPTWRLEHWRSKLNLEAIDRAIGVPKPAEWTPEKLKLADEFWAEQEHLMRDIYRLGPVRHVFGTKFIAPLWYDSWQRATKAAPKQQTMRPEA